MCSRYIELVALLLRQGARVDYREDTDDPFPRTLLCDEPLRLAIRNRHLEIARMLLEHGANPNKRYFFGSEINLVSPLDVEFLNLLLMFGADPNTRDRSGLTPLMKAVRLPQVRPSSLHSLIVKVQILVVKIFNMILKILQVFIFKLNKVFSDSKIWLSRTFNL